MLQVLNIRKQYKTGELIQSALDDVSLNLRDNEFVAILGPSGSGKTTLLNIIGGLDRYDSGDLIINGISTKRYKDRDWDSYRNHTIGFVFQSYNLIPHQSVLANVELALTISGISKGERKRRAKEALVQVGLGEHIHKKPNQMSGGQMQRVAIARALVNNPDILLADEPTGALDTETSQQVMALLKQVAKDRLVIMVTHNPELADTYANRIVRLRDGKIIDDTNPCLLDAENRQAPKHESMGKASMSFLTALSLSFNNLRTKKARTILTAFAGSIGIIGIALILSLSTGVNTYIENIQKETMTSYPITLESQSMDLGSLIRVGRDTESADVAHGLDHVYANSTDLEMASSVTTSIKENNLTAFKKYLDNPNSEIHNYLGDNGIIYSYDVAFDAFAYDPEGVLVNTDGSSLETSGNTMSSMANMGGIDSLFSSSENFEELMPGTNGALISEAVTDNYSLLHGSWPQDYDELVLVLDENNEISSTALYALGLLPASEYKALMETLNKGEEIEIEDHEWSYAEILRQTFYLIPAADYYVKNENGLFANVSDDKNALERLAENSVQLRITGIVRPNADASYSSISGNIGYTKALTDYLINYAANSAVVKAQEASAGINVVNGMAFAPANDAAKIQDATEYLENLSVSEKAKIYQEILSAVSAENPEMAQQALAMDEPALSAALDEFLKAPENETLLSIYNEYISPGSYDENMRAFGLVSLEAPSAINIYTESFENKDAVSACISTYNAGVSDENKITYTDVVGLLMSSITTIINVISYVLIAFVAVSLVVSSIMIGIITFISVLERTKEIGILRAIGASKHNISNVFNAETFIIGALSGLLGVGITALLLIPGNAIIHMVAGTTDINASLPILSGIILVALSMGLTLIAGFIPSKKAAKKDPVIALRTE